MAKGGVRSPLDAIKGEVIAHYQAGHTLDEVAERFGVANSTVHRALKRYGVDMWARSKHKPENGEAGWFCPGCRAIVPLDQWHNGTRNGRPQTARCRACLNAYTRARYQAEPERHRTYQRTKNPQARDRLRRHRQEIIDHYGGACACCGEATYEFLAIDHIQGGGNRHRAELKLQGVGAAGSFYRWIKNSGYPDLFRVLCHNCNLVIGHSGRCPHKDDGVPIRTGNKKATYEYRRRIRQRLIEGYGGKCACCGESYWEFLSIDHVDGGGTKHRLSLKEKGLSNYHLYRQIIKDGFPATYRILCMNCNKARGHYGACPHGGLTS